jgi:hypothetical protein
MSAPTKEVRQHLVPVALVAVFALLFGWTVLRLPEKWWFEDDPMQYAVSGAVSNPVRIFTDPSVQRSIGNGRAVTPFMELSFWTDMRLFGRSPAAAHLHSMVALAATAVMLYLFLWRITRSRTISAIASCLWTLLPSTVAVASFISTRHYLEGLFFALAFTWLLVSGPWRTREQQTQQGSALAGLVLLGAIAMLHKEVYVTWVLAALAMGAVHYRSLRLGLSCAGLALFYGVYHAFLVGSKVDYAMQLVGYRGILKFLTVLPYTLADGTAGYLVLALLAVLFALAFASKDPRAGRGAIFLASLVVAVLVALYPVMYALDLTYRTPGTWYRVAFPIDTLLLIALAYAASLTSNWKLLAPALAAALAAIVPGTVRTEAYWKTRYSQAGSEGTFYLANPDKLVYSQEDAYWFLVGVDRLYGISKPHYVLKAQPDPANDRKQIQRYGEIWDRQSQDFEPDPALRDEILNRVR